MDFLQQLNQQYGPQVAQQLASRYGIDPKKAADILPRMADVDAHFERAHQAEVASNAILGGLLKGKR